MNKLRIPWHEGMREEYGVNLYRPYSSQAHPLQPGIRKMCVRMPRDISGDSAHTSVYILAKESIAWIYTYYTPRKKMHIHQRMHAYADHAATTLQ